MNGCDSRKYWNVYTIIIAKVVVYLTYYTLDIMLQIILVIYIMLIHVLVKFYSKCLSYQINKKKPLTNEYNRFNIQYILNIFNRKPKYND